MRRAVEPAAFPYLDYKRYSFSLGIVAGPGLWLAGHSASRFSSRSGTVVVDGDLVAQARLAYEKIATILAAAGLGLRDVVRTVDYVSVAGMVGYERLARLRADLFGDHVPATSVVVVRSLLRPSALIEIEAIAAPGGGTAAGPPGHGGASARRLDDLLYLPTQLPLDPATGQVVGAGDVLRQTEQAYANAGAMLTAAGLGWQHVVKTVEFIRPEALERYRETGRVRRDLLGPAYPVATGIVMPRTAHDDALIQMDFVASFAPKQVIEVPWERFRHLTYVPAVRAGRHLCVAGIAPLDPETAVVQHPGDVVAQTRYVYGILAQILAAAGASMDAVVKTVEYVTPEGLPHYRETAAIRQELFTRPHPAATGVVCERLLRPGMTVEVDAWAIID